MKIAIGGDHAGYSYKQPIIDFLQNLGHEVIDFGTHSLDSVDYPDFAHPTALAVETSQADFGVLLCGSAQGVAITANKHQGIRAAVVWQKEIAELSRQHNNANTICIPCRFVNLADACQFISTFLSTDFEGGRHANRVNKMTC